MSYENITSEFSNGITTITINRPKKLNALNKATIQELHDAFDEANNDADTKVIIVTGSGEKAFVAGADISEFADFNVEEGGNLAAKGQALLFDFVEHLSTPVIAAVNGFALGGGLELAMACHMRIATANAKCEGGVWTQKMVRDDLKDNSQRPAYDRGTKPIKDYTK